MRQIVFVLCLVITATSVITSQGNGVGGVVDRAAVQALLNSVRNNPPYVPGEVLVQFRSGTSTAQQSSVLRLLRSTPTRTRSIGTAVLLSGLTGEEPEAAAAALARQPEVAFAQPNYIRKFRSIPNDPGYGLQWHMDAINMPLAWEVNTSAASGVTVGVLDTGLTTAQGTSNFSLWTGSSFGLFAVPFARATDFDHTRVKTGAEFTIFSPEGGWRSSSGQPLLFDSDGHGTHVAGTIAQWTDNREGFAGVAHGATLLPVKVCFASWDVQMLAGLIGEPGFFDLSGCADGDVAQGIRYAVDNGAQVLNISIGGPAPSPITLDALNYAVQKGVFVAISAGNDAQFGNPIEYPAGYATQLNGVVSVGATNRASQRAFYSNFGSYVELAAPGGEPGNPVWQTTAHQGDLDFSTLLAPRYDRYAPLGFAGTSMAAPHVAGLAALLRSHGITNPAAIEAAMKQYARDLGAPGRDVEFGHGLIDARATLIGLGLVR